jgi:predicted nucleotidyltransferase component of viral defense system
MIPMRYINEWRDYAPWQSTDYVEQDLVISRALIDIFQVPELRSSLAFRGGTALNKLYFNPATRYSEDIDLVQITAEPIGNTFDSIRSVLDPWLGEPKRSLRNGRANLYYRFASEEDSAVSMRLKVEINTREHFSAYDMTHIPYSMQSGWYKGAASITTFDFNELLATKLRALYSRKKGRDLYDLVCALKHEHFNLDLLLTAFDKYIASEGRAISRAEFEKNLFDKQIDKIFIHDMDFLLAPGIKWDPADGFQKVGEEIIAQIPGEPWSGIKEEQID